MSNAVQRGRRTELAWMAGVGAVAAAAFAVTFSGRLTLGDAPEFVTGVSTFGILHAPGYATYMVAAKLFTLLVPVGSIVTRVLLFSLVSSVAAVVLTFRIARLLDASRAAAAIGALVMALGTSFWFYAGYAKHTAFSLLLSAAAVWLVFEWDRRQRRWALPAAGAVLGLTIGASWQLAALLFPALVLFVLARRPLPLRRLVAPAAAGVVAAGAVLGFTALRASQEPAVNWGSATTPDRLVDLVFTRDFGSVSRSAGGGGQAVATERSILDYIPLTRVASAARRATLEFDLAVLPMAGWGAVVSWRRRPRRDAVFLSLALATNLVGNALFLGYSGNADNYDDVLRVGGFLSISFLVLALWVAIGVNDLAPRLAALRPRLTQMQVAAALGAAMVLPAALLHVDAASHREPGFADDYARNVLSTLPRDAVLFVQGAENTWPMVYRQLLLDERTDVDVVAVDGLTRDWYRRQTGERLGTEVPVGFDSADVATKLIGEVRKERPAFLDMRATSRLAGSVGYRLRGVVSEVVDGTGRAQAPVEEVQRRLDQGYRSEGVFEGEARHRWPNTVVVGNYALARLELARLHYEQAQQRTGTQARDSLDDAIANLEVAASIDPENLTVARSLDELTA